MINQQAKIYLKIIQKMTSPNTRNPTDEELNILQENLSEGDFEKVLQDLKDYHNVTIGEVIKTPVTDPHWYSLD